MQMSNSKRTWIVGLAMAMALSVPTVALTGCGGSSSNDSSNTTASSSAEPSTSGSSAQESTGGSSADTSTTSSDTSSSASDSDLSLDSVEKQMTSAYMGVNEDSGEGYYWASNDDGSLVMLAVLNTNNGADNATSASYVGHATVNGNNVVVTDYVTGNQIGFDVTNNNDGTVTLDLGDEYGKATIAQCDVSEVFNAFKTIDKYTTAVD